MAIAHDGNRATAGVDLEALVDRLAPIVSEQVMASVQQAKATTRRPAVAVGTVTDILDDPDDDICLVTMDDGGVEGADQPGIVPAYRMNGVVDGDRVRVQFWPGSGAEAHRVQP